MGMGVELMSRLEQEEVGLQWSNVADATVTLSSLSVAWTMGFLLIDTVVYMLLAWYSHLSDTRTLAYYQFL